MSDFLSKIFSLVIGLFVVVVAYAFFEPSNVVTITLFLLAVPVPYRMFVRATYKFHREI